MKSFIKGALAASLLAASTMTMADTGLYGIFTVQQAAIDSTIDKNSSTLQVAQNYTNATYGFNVAPQRNFSLDDTSVMSGSIGLGYMFTDNFGVEVAYNSYKGGDQIDGTYQLVGTDNVSAPIAVDIATKLDDVSSFSVAGIAQVSAGEGFAVFARAGAESWNAIIDKTTVMGKKIPSSGRDDNGHDFFAGFGFKMNISDNMLITNDYVWHKLHGNELDIDIQTIGLGLQYNF